MRLAEAAVFLPLAVGLHLGVWSVAPRIGGSAAQGDAEAVPLTLAAAAPSQADLARSWETAPDLAGAVAAPSPAIPAAAPPRIAPLGAGPALPAAPALTPVPPAARPPEPPAADPARTLPVPPAPDAPDPGEPADRPPEFARPDAPPAASHAPDRPPLAHRDEAAGRAPPPLRPRARPAPAAAREAAETPAARAAGTSAPARKPAGRDGASSARSEDVAASAALQAQWGARIQNRVHRQMIYPRGASGAGSASVILTVDRSGRLTALRLTRSSGTAVFDEAALRAVRWAGRFPAAPDGLTRDSYSFTLSLAFRP